MTQSLNSQILLLSWAWAILSFHFDCIITNGSLAVIVNNCLDHNDEGINGPMGSSFQPHPAAPGEAWSSLPPVVIRGRDTSPLLIPWEVLGEEPGLTTTLGSLPVCILFAREEISIISNSSPDYGLPSVSLYVMCTQWVALWMNFGLGDDPNKDCGLRNVTCIRTLRH